MKRIMALVLAIALLLASVAALAESSGSRLDMKHLKIKLVGDDSDEQISLHGMNLSVAVGSAEGVPTLQITLFYGDNQQLDCVMQIVGTRVMLCMGGISGTYYVDLADVLHDKTKGEMTATAIDAALQMFGANPDLVMELSMPKNEKGSHVARLEVPKEIYISAASRVMALLKGNRNMTEEELDVMRDSMEQADQGTVLEMRYRPKQKKIWLYFLQGEQGIRLFAKATMTTEPMEFINISQDEIQYDLLNLDSDTKSELQGELELLALKIGHFMTSTELETLMD